MYVWAKKLNLAESSLKKTQATLIWIFKTNMSKITLPTLETSRLILRPLSFDDVEAIFKWTGDPRVNKYMIYPLYKSVDEVQPWVETLYEDEKKLDYGFVLKETGELIGSGGLYYHEDIDVWSVGYNLAFDFWIIFLEIFIQRFFIKSGADIMR